MCAARGRLYRQALGSPDNRPSSDGSSVSLILAGRRYAVQVTPARRTTGAQRSAATLLGTEIAVVLLAHPALWERPRVRRLGIMGDDAGPAAKPAWCLACWASACRRAGGWWHRNSVEGARSGTRFGACRRARIAESVTWISSRRPAALAGVAAPLPAPWGQRVLRVSTLGMAALSEKFGLDVPAACRVALGSTATSGGLLGRSFRARLVLEWP